MEGSVKERLTGAVIFVAVVVIIVPEMFSGPAPRPVEAAPAQSPESGPPLRTYSMTLSDGVETRAPVPSAEPVSAALPAEPSAAPVATDPVPAESTPVAAVVANSAAPGAVNLAAGASWWLQVGIFSSRDNAQRLAQKLRSAGFAVDMDKYLAGGKEMYRVRAGPVRDRAEALALQGRLAASGSNSLLLPP